MKKENIKELKDQLSILTSSLEEEKQVQLELCNKLSKLNTKIRDKNVKIREIKNKILNIEIYGMDFILKRPVLYNNNVYKITKVRIGDNGSIIIVLNHTYKETYFRSKEEFLKRVIPLTEEQEKQWKEEMKRIREENRDKRERMANKIKLNSHE